MPGQDFKQLITRIRAGDSEAAAELHQIYGEQLRRVIRVRLTDPALRRHLDSIDICQSVFADFFVRMAVGEFDISEPDDLLKLLATMARHRLIHHAKKQKAARRDIRRNLPHSVDQMNLADDGETPSQIIAAAELLDNFMNRLSADERRIANRRREGRTWDEIGTEFGQTGEALRKRFERTVREVSQSLGIDDSFGE